MRKTTIVAVPCTEDKGNALVGQAVAKDCRLISTESGEESGTSLEQHSQPVAVSDSLADDHAVLTERHLSAATEQQNPAEAHMQQEQPKLATDSPANEELSGEQKLRLMEQECCMAQEQSKKLEEHVRYVQLYPVRLSLHLKVTSVSSVFTSDDCKKCRHVMPQFGQVTT